MVTTLLSIARKGQIGLIKTATSYGKEFKATKDQVSWRLARLRENTFFDRMFSHSKSKLDLFTEMNESKVILIHTDVDNLKAEGTNVLGRYFIGALLAVSQERASLSHSKRLPVFAYINVCIAAMV